MAILEVNDMGKKFTNHHFGTTRQAVHHVTFQLEKGQFIGIVGKSGSGKSTILKSIYRTYLPDEGSIYFDSEYFGKLDLTEATERQIIYLRKHEIGYVSQFLNVMPRRTCRELVEQAVLEMGETKAVAKRDAEIALMHFELDPTIWDTFPNTFSGGEKLRLNIAIATVKKPRLLLLDEPTASLDEKSKQRVRDVIEKLKASGTTLVGIFHDIEFMENLCDQIFDMNSKQIMEVASDRNEG
ncbi:ATP-binding cassette domain-containing protein [Ornithinibacillus sp. L9]|uniref:ATP-binding cassette domain-containing protein n=1 Tax=Ornithinibacillus caprae TaxID=2678566 RepID=A0A6N8FL02_9BACI|nr:ATP-binding cassette domain-containing protein [Ornithinibacillus caprae]MUK90322.1 ATP-binding cassette domain-containing protein [Ornithinibacillus caprae]